MSSTIQVPNFYWPDTSGFCFDLPPRDVTGGWSNTLTGGIYQIPDLPQALSTGGYNGWTNWIDKAQKDYRFGAMSDENAVANLFPNVDDPWMFTEYVYEGTGKATQQDASVADVAIVAPPLVNPFRITRTFASGVIASTTLLYANETFTTYMAKEPRYAFEIEYQWRSQVNPYTLYWESELDAVGWVESNSGGLRNTSFTRTTTTRRRVRFQHPSNNAGVALNRVKVWAHATHWGQSQNVPQRVVNMTGPPDWFLATEMAGTTIVPHISIVQGEPVYDIAPQVGGQGTIIYNNVHLGLSAYGATAASIAAGNPLGICNVGMKAVTPDGTYNGVSDGTFAYSVPTSLAGTSAIPLPVPSNNPNNSPVYTWTYIGYSSGDVVHRGCAFWKGTGGVCQCTYTAKLPAPTVTITAFQPTTTFAIYNLPAEIDLNAVGLEVMFAATSAGPWSLPSACGQQVVMLYTTDIYHAQQVKLVKIGNSPFTIGSVRFRSQTKNRPRPHNTLCAFSDGTVTNPAAAYYQMANQQHFTPCPFYTAQGPRVVASFEATAANGAEWANLQRGLPATSAAREPVYATDSSGNYLLNSDGTRQIATNPDGSEKTAVVVRPYVQAPAQTALGQILTSYADATPALGIGGIVISNVATSIVNNIQTPNPLVGGISPTPTLTTMVTCRK